MEQSTAQHSTASTYHPRAFSPVCAVGNPAQRVFPVTPAIHTSVQAPIQAALHKLRILHCVPIHWAFNMRPLQQHPVMLHLHNLRFIWLAGHATFQQHLGFVAVLARTLLVIHTQYKRVQLAILQASDSVTTREAAVQQLVGWKQPCSFLPLLPLVLRKIKGYGSSGIGRLAFGYVDLGSHGGDVG